MLIIIDIPTIELVVSLRRHCGGESSPESDLLLRKVRKNFLIFSKCFNLAFFLPFLG